MTFFTAARRHLLIALTLVVSLSFSAYAHDGEHGYLGVMLQSISNSMAKALQLNEDQGVLINKVIEDGPAEKAGLEDGDVILAFNGQDITEHSDLTKAVRSTSSGDVAKVEVMSGGKRKTVEVTMGENDDNSFSYSFSDDNDVDVQFFGEGHNGGWIGSDNNFVFEVNSDHGFMGVELEDISEQLGEYFGASDGEGALVSKVVEDSPAEKSGIKAGDVIVSLGDDEITSASDVFDVMAGTEAEDTVDVTVLRDGKTRSISVILAESPERNWAPEQLHTLLSPRAPHQMRTMHGLHGDRDIRVVSAPRHRTRVMRLHGDDLSELKSELKELKNELKELQKALDN